MHFGLFIEESRRGVDHTTGFRDDFELVEVAEASGVDGVWLGEIHFNPDRSVMSPWWYAPPPVYAYAQPPVIVQPAPVYVAPPPPPQYGYLCQSFNAYYPQTPTCPEPWVLVPVRPY